ncbi:hypothetical protein PFICI_11615 [Pestalotiopsis fici W106-1]|uniref:Zn(2)-C6 fungal-type domain-containing protein n=1 Tax=Pestalotiopsis fici (strain W106-1 / CGMCC3.15140) TaxID=1229662 RepID=W3WQW9_PESFW|nr:uncharacterized protein PFICI_11615 [Pestalotiopsis fici W106-1]ETS76228.1 hypothetical protein PFICI_11615 [Pestalotiopsis fici W106-1]
MPKVAKGARKREFAPKTRTGCITCKIRRVKCDEARPACVRCTSTGRTCDGYPHISTAESSSSLSSSSSPERLTVTLHAGPSVQLFDTPQSKRSFAFFRQRTSPQLSGFFKSEFWESLVFRVAYHESAIRHAVVALGAAHEASERRSASPSAIKTFAVEQYNLAIKELLIPLARRGEGAVDVCLIACIMFVNFESLRGCHTAAMAHVRSGSKLLRETVYDQQTGQLRHSILGPGSRTDSYVLLDVIARIFVWLDGESGITIRDYEYASYEKFFSPDADDSSPMFSSIGEARNILEYGVCYYTCSGSPQLLGDPSQSTSVVQAHKDYYVRLLSRFTTSLQHLEDSQPGGFSSKDELAINVLHLNATSFYVSFHLDYLPPDRRDRWQDLMPCFERMVALGDKIVSAMVADHELGTARTSFCPDIGFVIPLFNVASQCRDSSLRRRAIALLRSVSRQEGVWNSMVTAQAAERLMEVEEQGYVVTPVRCQETGELGAPTAWPLLKLDGLGARLEYMRHGHTDKIPVRVNEILSTWEPAELLSGQTR